MFEDTMVGLSVFRLFIKSWHQGAHKERKKPLFDSLKMV